jgi:hypothetical protein
MDATIWRCCGHQQRSHGRWSRSGETHRLALVSSCDCQRRHHQVNRAGNRATSGDVAGTGSGHDLTHQVNRSRSGPPAAQPRQAVAVGHRPRTGESYRLAPRQATGSGGELARATGHAQAHQQCNHGRWSWSGESRRLALAHGCHDLAKLWAPAAQPRQVVAVGATGHDLARGTAWHHVGPLAQAANWCESPATLRAPAVQPRQVVAVGRVLPPGAGEFLRLPAETPPGEPVGPRARTG